METAGRNLKGPRRLGRTELLVTPIGLGCWQFSQGRGLVGHYWAIVDDAEIRKILAQAMDGGINWFDTAEGYGKGESERALARGLRNLGKSPGDVVIATKWNPFLRRASSIPETIKTRLANLNPFPIDLYQIHNPFSVSSIERQIGAMARLIEDGKIRYAGVSNFSRRQMERAHRALLKVGLPLASNQVRYSLLDRSIERNGVLEAAEELGIGIIAYSPLAQGILSGKFHDDPGLIRSRPGFRKYMSTFKPRGLKKSSPVIDALRRIAPEYGATPAQVALNWLVSKAGVFAIPRASRARHVVEDLGASDWRLSDSDVAELEREFPLDKTSA